MKIEVIENADEEPRYELVEHLELKVGDKIAWVYKDEHTFWKGENWDVTWEEHRSNTCYVGIILPPPDFEMRGGTIAPEEAIICIIDYPCEKTYPEVVYITMDRLLSNPELYEVFEE